MTRVRVLPPDLANRIAAGEVVERPASVVKELLENSLDAGAGRIDVAIEAGGRGLVQVLDDGEGMSREDLVLSIERHATSKILSAEDLDSIRTLGFRGEALPSIGSVSLLRLTTAQDDSGSGWSLEVAGGSMTGPEPAARARGTTAEVRNLFFNTPARRKFLRSVEREATVIRETVHALALAHPAQACSLTSDGRMVLACPRAENRAERVSQLSEAGVKYLHAARDANGIRVEVFVSGQDQTRPARTQQRYLVNGRPVRDKTLSHAVASVTGAVFPPGRHPHLVLYVDLPSDLVDVNAHPAKTEIRFRRSGDIHSAVTATLGAALRDASLASPRMTSISSGAAPFVPVPLFTVSERSPWVVAPPGAPPAEMPAGAHDPADFRDRADARILAQYRDSYVVTADADGILLVDQHAAHERILFEKFLDRLERRAPASQALLHPIVVELDIRLRGLLAERGDDLPPLGLDVEPFGDSAALVRAVPAELGPIDPAAFLTDILTDLARDREVPADEADDADASVLPERFPDEAPVRARRRRAAASAACQAAIKVNFPLTQAKMAWLLATLAQCRVPTTCPHGRPTRLRIGHGAIERAFLRV